MTVSKLLSILSIGVLLILLVLVRLYEVELFQDPLNEYFHSRFQLYDLPKISIWKTLAGTSLRYLFNMVLSLWMLWFLFKKKEFLNAALWVYLFAFVILIISFKLLLEADTNFMKMALFYVRRFLIHPILLFVLVAGFYFLKTKGEKLN